MRARLILIGGTGTGVGKTHVAEALLLAWRRRGGRVVGLKPVESGVVEGVSSDAERLANASSFHVKHFRYSFADPVSPHLAARRAGETIRREVLEAEIARARAAADGVLVELPGGLFTPLADGMLNADLARHCEPDSLVVVAPDRLGVLHDLISLARAAHAENLSLRGILLVSPEHPDASTGTNAEELSRFVAVPVLGTLPRASPSELATAPAMELILGA